MAGSVTVQDGDLVMVRRGGTYVAIVQRARATELAIMPCDPTIPDRRIKVTEVIAVYRNIGAPADPPRRLRPSLQMRLDGTI
jgi:hypothetical protein